MAPAWQTKASDWDTMVRTNISGLIATTHALLPGMVERNRGYVIGLGSTAGTYPYPGGNVYGASKAFVSHFMQNLKSDLVGTNVRVTSVEPGLVGGTEFSTIRLGDSDKAPPSTRAPSRSPPKTSPKRWAGWWPSRPT